MSEILQLQLTLSRLGYQPGVIDGIWGPNTRAALEAAQQSSRRARGLDPVDALAVLLGEVAKLRRGVPALTLAEVLGVFPRFGERGNPLQWLGGLNLCLQYVVADQHRAAFLIGQLAHESAGFATLEEYASGAAYEGRADLGNVQPGDGRRYKGRGPIQTTGRANYRRVGRALGVPAEERPELLATPLIGFLSAGLYWLDHGLNALADAGDVDAITRRINGGTNGRDDRIEKTRAAAAMLARRQA